MKMIAQSKNNQSVNKYYVYGHYTKTDQLFYIGVGTILNFKTKKETQKYSRAYHFSNRNKFWKHVANKHGVKVKILGEYSTKEESLKEEKKLIEFCGRRWMKNGFLCNISSGGEIGPIGRRFKMSDEQKKKLSDAKSITLFVYNSVGIFLTEIKTINNTAKYCGVTYNAVHTCINAKNNRTNGYFIFKEYRGQKINRNIAEISHINARIVLSESSDGVILEHKTMSACAEYLGCARESVRDAVKRNGSCKKHKVYLKDNQQPST